ncbi:hypothetical protein LEMLEM_LOCUS4923 [Lemmus lemmus]
MKGSQTHGKLQAAQREKRRKHPRSSEGNKASRVNLTGCSACGGPWRCKRFCRLWIFKMLACHSQVPLWMLAPYFSVLKEDCKGPIAQLPENGEKNGETLHQEGAWPRAWGIESRCCPLGPPLPPAALPSLPLSVHLSTVLISKPHKDTGCGNTLMRGAQNQVPGFINKLVPRNRGLLAIKSLFCCPHLGWTACFDTQI